MQVPRPVLAECDSFIWRSSMKPDIGDQSARQINSVSVGVRRAHTHRQPHSHTVAPSTLSHPHTVRLEIHTQFLRRLVLSASVDHKTVDKLSTMLNRTLLVQTSTTTFNIPGQECQKLSRTRTKAAGTVLLEPNIPELHFVAFSSAHPSLGNTYRTSCLRTCQTLAQAMATQKFSATSSIKE